MPTNVSSESRPRRWRPRIRTIALLLLILSTLGIKYATSTKDLTWAIIHDDVAKARWALRFGADVEYLQRGGWHRESLSDSRLTLAAKRGDPEMIALLVEWGADVNRADGHGKTPLEAACFSGNVQAVEFLIAKGAKLSNSGSGSNELSIAIGCDHPDVVSYLLDNGVSIDAPGEQNFRPLYKAVWLGKPDMVRLLLERGADPTLFSSGRKKMTARQLAEARIAYVRSNIQEINAHRTSQPNAPPPISNDDTEKEIQRWKEVIEVLDSHEHPTASD